MAFKHYFRCGTCGYHVTFATTDAPPVQPGRTHDEAIKNGALKMGANDPSPMGCIGVISYCSGMDPKTLIPCPSHHPGTEKLYDPPAPVANPEWTTFAGIVQAAWQLYVNSNYAMTLRGPNHDHSYHPGPGVRTVLQGSGGVVKIHGGLYTVSNSLTSGASLKRDAVGHATFIYHL